MPLPWTVSRTEGKTHVTIPIHMEKVVSDTTPHPRVGSVHGKCVAVRWFKTIRVSRTVYWSIHRSAIHSSTPIWPRKKADKITSPSPSVLPTCPAARPPRILGRQSREVQGGASIEVQARACSSARLTGWCAALISSPALAVRATGFRHPGSRLF